MALPHLDYSRNYFVMFVLGEPTREKGRQYHPESAGLQAVTAKKVLGSAGPLLARQ